MLIVFAMSCTDSEIVNYTDLKETAPIAERSKQMKAKIMQASNVTITAKTNIKAGGMTQVN